VRERLPSVPVWMTWTVLGALAAATYPVLPPVAQSILFGVLPLVGAILILWSVRHDGTAARPWRMLALMLLLSSGAEAIWAYDELRGVEPFPSVADALWLASYPFAFAALLALVRQRGGHARGSAIDAGIVAAGSAVLAWLFLAAPYAQDPTLTFAERTIPIAYPVADLLVLAVIARVLCTPAPRPPSLALVAASFACILVADVGFAVLVLQDAYVSGSLLDVWWVLGYVLIASAALHPRRHERRADEGADALPPSRLGILGVATALPPGVLVVEGLRGGEADGVVIGVLCLVIFGLVLARMAQLVRTITRQSQLLEELSDTDELTGLPNRRFWSRHLPLAIEQAARTGRPACVALVDLDHFKRFNDTRGHLAGDEMLREAAVAWRSVLRGQDLLARYGGEEFLVVLPGCDADGGLLLIERLRAATPRGQRCSAGIAVLHGDESVDELLARADTALYRAKGEGRDRSVVDDSVALTA
jgi:diguanylate cyclase (GGDEF)-like protein